MGKIQTTDQGETPSPGEPMSSMPVSSHHNLWSDHIEDGSLNGRNNFPVLGVIGSNVVSGVPRHPSTVQANQDPIIGNPWTTGLFNCHEHQTNAIMTAVLPCVTFGQISEILDGGEMTCPLGSFIYLLMMPALCSHWIMGSKYRTKLRKKYNLVEAPYEDKISHIFCPCCSLCQEFRELKSRGLDPSLGWKGNLAQQQYQDQIKTPPANQTMKQ